MAFSLMNGWKELINEVSGEFRLHYKPAPGDCQGAQRGRNARFFPKKIPFLGFRGSSPLDFLSGNIMMKKGEDFRRFGEEVGVVNG